MDYSPFRRSLKFCLLAIALSSPHLKATAILSFPASEGRFMYFENNPADSSSWSALAPGETKVVFNAVFGPNIARNPSLGYFDTTPVGGLGPWTTPAFYGGYRLTTSNNSNGVYLPNFVRGVVSPDAGAGYASLPVTQVFAFGSSGTLTNTVTGAFVTPTPIATDGIFHVDLLGTSLGGAVGLFRGVIFDGTNWLVTSNVGFEPSSGTTGVDISTVGGWQILNPTDFSILPGLASPQGPVTYSGLWFHATEASSIPDAGFDFRFSNVSFSTVPEGGLAWPMFAFSLMITFALRCRRST